MNLNEIKTKFILLFKKIIKPFSIRIQRYHWTAFLGILQRIENSEWLRYHLNATRIIHLHVFQWIKREYFFFCNSLSGYSAIVFMNNTHSHCTHMYVFVYWHLHIISDLTFKLSVLFPQHNNVILQCFDIILLWRTTFIFDAQRCAQRLR